MVITLHFCGDKFTPAETRGGNDSRQQYVYLFMMFAIALQHSSGVARFLYYGSSGEMYGNR